MNNRTETLLKAALLIGLGLMLYEKITSGTLGFYINARFAWLTYVGAMLFIALGLGLVGRLMSQRSAAPELSPAATRLSWPAVGLMALPLAGHRASMHGEAAPVPTPAPATSNRR